MSDLTTKQRRFVEEYCVDFNATQAAIRAGYSEKTARQIGSENLSKPDIEGAITDRLEELSMTSAEALKRMSDWGRGSLEPFLRVYERSDDDDRLMIDLTSEQARANMHLIREIKQTKTVTTGKDDYTKEEMRTEIKLHDAKDAVDKILRAHGTYRDSLDVTSGGKALVLRWSDDE